MNKVLDVIRQISDKSDKLNYEYQINPVKRKYSMVYRGQANNEWGITPSIFRGANCDQFIIEHRTINEYIAKFPEFGSQPKINVLADMQHYGIPTRLIDWTTNPLVALFFACNDESQKDSDGKVFISVKDYHATPQQSLKFAELICEIASYDIAYNSTPPSLSSNSIDYYNNLQFAHLFAIKFYEMINCYGATQISENDTYFKNIKTHLKPTNNDFTNNALKLLKKIVGDSAYEKEHINDKFLGFLKSAYGPYWFIDAPKINQRIIAQNGLFQVYMGKSYLTYDGKKMFPVVERAAYDFPDNYFIIINKSDKEEIIKELDKYFNINPVTLYLKDKQKLVDEFKHEIGIVKSEKTS